MRFATALDLARSSTAAARAPAAPQAAGRCVLLTPPSQLPAAIRQLFHASTRERAQPGCLLEQVASHMLLGLGLAADAASKALQGPFRPQPALEGDAAAAGQQQQAAAVTDGGPGSGRAQRQLSRAALSRSAGAAAEAGVGQVLQAVSTCGAMAGVLQQHYSRVLAPHLAGSGAEARACVAGLAALVRAVDERAAAALQRCLAGLCAQVDATLAEQQQRADFCPGDTGALASLEEPTPAAAAACALLGAGVDAAERHLHGPNLAAFAAEVRRGGAAGTGRAAAVCAVRAAGWGAPSLLAAHPLATPPRHRAQLGRRLCLLLDAHQQRFSFSPLGALRWKRDLGAYAALAARLRSPATRRHLEDMQVRGGAWGASWGEECAPRSPRPALRRWMHSPAHPLPCPFRSRAPGRRRHADRVAGRAAAAGGRLAAHPAPRSAGRDPAAGGLSCRAPGGRRQPGRHL